MQLDKIKSLIDAMAASDLAEMEFSEDGWSLRLSRGAAAKQPAIASPAPARARAPRAANPAAAAVQTDAPVRSPLYGVVWMRPNPASPDFVAPGASVEPGQTLCIVEAMKVFHEIRAERAGTVAALLVASGDEVEAGQDLIRFG